MSWAPVTDLDTSPAAIRALLDDVDNPDALTEAARRARALLSHVPGEAARDLKRFIELIEFAETPVDGETKQLIRAAWQTYEGAILSPASAEPTPVVRDPDSVAIFADFLQEAEDGLTAADEILMNAEHAPVSPSDVNALFRVFHTIKGVAGFLDLDEIGSLAHITETLLGNARDGTYVIDSIGVDALISAVATVRKLLSLIAQAVKAGTTVRRYAGLQETIARIELLTRISSAPMSLEVSGANLIPFAEPAPAAALAPPAPPAPPKKSIAPRPSIAARKPSIAAGRKSIAAGPKASAAAANAEDAPTESGAAALKQTVKLDVERVDAVVEMIGELVIVEAMLTHSPELDQHPSPRLRAHLAQLAKISRDLQTVAMRMRMVPVRTAFQKMPRLLRETAKKAQKDVHLTIDGETTEMDRSMVERLGDPLVHMLRNSVDHGIEAKEERRGKGKAPQGNVWLSAYHEGSTVVIEVRDDGRGLDKEKIYAKAVKQGLIRTGASLSDDEIYQLIFAPGFSTAAAVTEISGRGVGMDVVKKTVEAMRGRIVISTVLGEGTTFKLVLPLTLAIIDATVVRCGAERYIIPSLSIVETVRPLRGMISTMGSNHELLRFRGRVLPLFRTSDLFQIEGALSEPTDAMVVVVESSNQHIALLVDEIIGQQQVVCKTLDGTMAHSSSFVGAAIVAEGQVALILNVDDLGRLGEEFTIAAGRRPDEVAA